jgi:hypothetical protein
VVSPNIFIFQMGFFPTECNILNKTKFIYLDMDNEDCYMHTVNNFKKVWRLPIQICLSFVFILYRKKHFAPATHFFVEQHFSCHR